jgi:hypothetical protein
MTSYPNNMLSTSLHELFVNFDACHSKIHAPCLKDLVLWTLTNAKREMANVCRSSVLELFSKEYCDTVICKRQAITAFDSPNRVFRDQPNVDDADERSRPAV